MPGSCERKQPERMRHGFRSASVPLAEFMLAVWLKNCRRDAGATKPASD
jgi:hypothetical protein